MNETCTVAEETIVREEEKRGEIRLHWQKSVKKKQELK